MRRAIPSLWALVDGSSSERPRETLEGAHREARIVPLAARADPRAEELGCSALLAERGQRRKARIGRDRSGPFLRSSRE
jgi:hypothetical protein